MSLKTKAIFLILIIVILFSQSVMAENRPIIKEIVIIGPTRSDEDIIVRQLPFKEGDLWEEGVEKLIYRRIQVLNIFNPMELKVIVEPVGDDVRVVIRATDTDILYIDPVEVAILKTVDLSNKQFNQEIRSPLGKGVCYIVGTGWGANPWWKVGLSYPVSKGISIKWLHTDFDWISGFNGYTYHQDGIKESLNIRQIYRQNWEFNYGVNYRANTYKISGEERIEQQYLTGSLEVIWKEYGELKFSILRGEALQISRADYTKIMVDYLNKYSINSGEYIFRFQGGVTSPETPLNLQFQGGGFSSIPLRGYSYNLAGDRFLRGTIEYHQKLPIKGLHGIIFADYGKIVPTGRMFTKEDWLVSGGIGLAYDTPLEEPVRCDIAFNQEGEYNWKIGFGHSF